MIELAAAFGGYLIGAIPFALLIGRWRRRDLRSLGTGNLGASNTYRQVGRGWGAVVLLLDAGKAMGPMCFLYFQLGSHWAAAVWAICAFIGHCWPIYLGFARAGRGVAVLAGMFLAFGLIENTLGYLIGAIAGYGAGLAVRRPGFAIVAQILGAIGFLPVIGAGAPTVVATLIGLLLLLYRRSQQLSIAYQDGCGRLRATWLVLAEDTLPGQPR